MRQPRAQPVIQFMRDGAWIDAQPLPDVRPARPVLQLDTECDAQAYGERIARRRAALLTHLGATVRWLHAN